MNGKKTIIFLLIGVLAAAAVFGLVAFRSVSAAALNQADPTAAPGTAAPNTTVPNQTLPKNKEFNHGFGMKGAGVTSNQDLADALGITVDQLNTAIQKAKSGALDQAVKDGLITQAQADQLRSNGKAFPLGRAEGWLSQNGIDYNALLANALGISVDKLQAAYQTAYNTRIDQAVANGRLTQEQADLMKGKYALYANKNFQSAMQSAFENAVKQAVTDGVITQAQADQILKDQTGTSGFGIFNRGGVGEFFEFGRHGGRRGGAAPSGSAAPNAPASPSATPSGSSGL